MKFVALISGGKDSFYNIHHCLSNGHDMVALANLYPESNVDEIDSFMFQTVGHDNIDKYEECLGVPLYRQKIVGSSANQELEYSVTEKDEIEDLYKLLSKVKLKHPDVAGVSCGAILSNYQRTRVENVCSRLSLTCLAFLWQRDQTELMQEMVANQLDARLIKVAAVGLTAQNLGKSIKDSLPLLLKLNQMYEVHVCGEGGEFETMVLDAPFFKKKLEILDNEIVVNGDVSYMRFMLGVIDKDNRGNQIVEAPALLDSEFSEVYEELESPPQKGTEPAIPHKRICPEVSIRETEKKVDISNLSASGLTIEEEAEKVFVKLESIIKDSGWLIESIQHVTLLLRDMNEFQNINKVYSKFFETSYLPPSRICVETCITRHMQLSCVLIKKQDVKKGIHIRSRSYWAPQNIGPYSQSIIEERGNYKIATLSGQIPLIPKTMELSGRGINLDSVLSLQHLTRVKSLISINNNGYIICFIKDNSIFPLVRKTWKLLYGSDHRLIVVRVSELPKGAEIEWGGISFEDIKGLYEDDDEGHEMDERSLIIVKTFEQHHTVKIGNGSVFLNILFTNDSKKVDQLDKMSGRIVIITKGNFFLNNSEVLPVFDLFNSQGDKFEICVIWTIEY